MLSNEKNRTNPFENMSYKLQVTSSGVGDGWSMLCCLVVVLVVCLGVFVFFHVVERKDLFSPLPH